jgi:acetyl-CoA synthetase
VLDVGPDGQVAPLTYGEMRDASNRLANVLASQGVGAGDRVAILLPQGATVPIAHVAVTRWGRSRCRSPRCSGSMRWATGCATRALRR